ncbi:SIMPL domain-containing protein [Thalassotalea euphylliae]|uniref:SIMPL domain-containing protein n=1 Tax=Thalassotalea euphylliae TaxID=1655234 RepID=UPI003630B69C
MRINPLLLTPFLFLFALTPMSHAQDGITVVGKATIEKEPDQFKVTFTIEDRGYSLSKTKAGVDNRVKMLTQAALGLNVPKEGITTTQLQVYPIYPTQPRNAESVYVSAPSNDGAIVEVAPGQLKKDEVSRIKSFSVSRRVDVTLADIDDYERLIDKASKIGVTRISPVQTSISDTDNLYQQALSLAVANARKKAERLAGNLGVKLGKVVVLNEHSHRAPSPMMMAADAMGKEMVGSSFAGLDQISAEVTVTFSLKP